MTTVEAPRQGWHAHLLVQDTHVYILYRAPRSKWYRLTCFCKRQRKDGSCKRTDAVLEAQIKPEARYRVKVEHA